MKRWLVLLGCFVGMAVATPAILLQPMGLFLKPVTAEFGWSRTQFSLILSAAALFNGGAMPVAGYLADRFGAPRVIAAGTVLGCATYAALSMAHSYGGFVAIVAVAAMTGSMASYPSFMGLAQRWFDRRLGFALAITSTGLAVGVAGFSSLVVLVIRLHGWRAAFLAVAAVACLVGLLNLLLLVRDTDGRIPDAERCDGPPGIDDGGLTPRQALRTRDFWLYAASFSLVILAVVGCNFHLPALLSDRGASSRQIASVVSVGAAGSLVGRLFTGIMLDRFPVRRVAGLFLLGQAVGFLLLLDGLRWALPAGFLLGAVQGAEIDVMGFVIRRRFGRRAYAQILGTCFAVTLVGAVAGPVVMGEIFDRTRSYDLGLMVFPLFPAIAFVLFCQARYARQAAPLPAAAATLR